MLRHPNGFVSATQLEAEFFSNHLDSIFTPPQFVGDRMAQAQLGATQASRHAQASPYSCHTLPRKRKEISQRRQELKFMLFRKLEML